MTIRSFAFEDMSHPWSVEHFQLDRLNLLVGLSGAGKTRTLASLHAVCCAARGDYTSLPGCRWTISVETEAGVLTWTAETASEDSEQAGSSTYPSLGFTDLTDPESLIFNGLRMKPILFLTERVHDENDSTILVRTQGGVQIGNSAPIRLSDRQSTISLFSSDDRVASLHTALRRVRWSRSHKWPISDFDSQRLERALDRHKSLESLQEDSSLSMIEKAYVMQQNLSDCFETFKDSYMEIFDTVVDITVQRMGNPTMLSLPSDFERLDLAIKEDGVDGWVPGSRLSSGMQRTLAHLLDVILAPRGTVILVDEYENSMGVNCLSAVTSHIVDRTRDLQFIITSHHPFVINNIDKKWWKIVTRRGHSVKVVPADTIPALNTSSKQSAFDQLLNASEYEGGIL